MHDGSQKWHFDIDERSGDTAVSRSASLLLLAQSLTVAEVLLRVVLALCSGGGWKAPLVQAGWAFENHTWQKGARKW